MKKLRDKSLFVTGGGSGKGIGGLWGITWYRGTKEDK